MKPSPASPTTRRRGARIGTSAFAGSLLAASLTMGLGAAPAGAGEPDLRVARLCDPTACLVAWNVVDSDGDGVSDADELMAGTDPHDAASRAPMAILGQLLLDRQLPSFEYGLATMVVLPADLVEMNEKIMGDRLEGLLFDGFGLAGRKDTLGGLGISIEQMGALGVDPARGGFTVGLEQPSKDDGGMPHARVGGIDTRTISCGFGDDDVPLNFDVPDVGNGVPTDPTAHGAVVDSFEIYSGAEYTLYDDGTATYIDEWGGYETTNSQVTNVWGLYRDPDAKYESPDADDGGGTTTVDPIFSQPEKGHPTVPLWIRTLGATEHRIDGWEAPKADGQVDLDRGRSLISYIESDLDSSVPVGALIDFDPALVTTAQPEGRPDLPNPMEGAPAGGTTGGGGGDGGGYDGTGGGSGNPVFGKLGG